MPDSPAHEPSSVSATARDDAPSPLSGRGARARSGRRLPLAEVGEDPDPRVTFANQRTFLAWNRTALALIGGGLAVVQFVHFKLGGARLVIALPLIVLGAVLGLSSYRRWETNERCLRLGQPLPYSRLPQVLAIGTGVVAVAAGVLAVVASSR